MNGYATVANSYMPSICVGYNPDAERPAYDPELAKQLLAEAGYPDGFYLRIDARSDSDMNADQVSQAIASYLEKVGITTEVNLLPRASFYEKVVRRIFSPPSLWPAGATAPARAWSSLTTCSILITASRHGRRQQGPLQQSRGGCAAGRSIC